MPEQDNPLADFDNASKAYAAALEIRLLSFKAAEISTLSAGAQLRQDALALFTDEDTSYTTNSQLRTASNKLVEALRAAGINHGNPEFAAFLEKTGLKQEGRTADGTPLIALNTHREEESDPNIATLITTTDGHVVQGCNYSASAVNTSYARDLLHAIQTASGTVEVSNGTLDRLTDFNKHCSLPNTKPGPENGR